MSRKEQWSEGEDKILSSTVQQFVSKNKTKKAAFLEASDKLGRTEVACAYRWNKVLKEKHLQKNEQPQDVLHEDSPEVNIEKCIVFLGNLKDSANDREIKKLQKEKNDLLLEQKRLKTKLKNLKEKEIKMKQMLAILKEAEELNFDTNKTSKSVH
jgi:prespore-specific regulator